MSCKLYFAFYGIVIVYIPIVPFFFIYNTCITNVLEGSRYATPRCYRTCLIESLIQMLCDNLIHNLEVPWLVLSNHRLSGKLARRTYFKSNSETG